jgi:hypothetical protein
MGFATRIKATRICSADEDVRIGSGEIFNGRIGNGEIFTLLLMQLVA